jgi:voltage-gated potassium channel
MPAQAASFAHSGAKEMSVIAGVGYACLGRLKAASMNGESNKHKDIRRTIAAYMAPGMFVVSLIFLVCQAVLVVILVDMPNFSEHAGTAMDPSSSTRGWLSEIATANGVELSLYEATVRLLFVLWPIVIAESIFHWVTRSWDAKSGKLHLMSLMYCLCPSLRMCARSYEMGNRLWLPGLGWRHPNRRLRSRLERRFSLPMIAIAFLILPVLVIEFFLHDQVENSIALWLLLHVGTGVIWLAFAAEFILMVSVAEKKLDYCKEHWLDMAIILLPLISFLRSVKFVRATNALKLPQITKMLRVYRMRGTAVKALRGLILLDLFSRFFGSNVDAKIDCLERELQEAQDRVREIRRKISKAERKRATNIASVEVGPESGSESGSTSHEDLEASGGKSGVEAEVEAEAQRDDESALETDPRRVVTTGDAADPAGDARLAILKTRVMRSKTVVAQRPK